VVPKPRRNVMDYRVVGLSPQLFQPLFELSDGELAERGIVRKIVEEANAYPCRVSLEDARPGEEVLLLPYRHLVTSSPYQASGPIYVRREARRAYEAMNALPAMQRRRLCSVRAYDEAGFMVEADVVPGADLEGVVRRFLEKPDVAWVDVHNAKPGCFAFRVGRA
jgi:hypothetical protein